MSLQLDHLVINNHFMLDECVTLFQHLGFTLTPKSYHSLGSVNALIVFQDSYIELIGLPQNASPVRLELLESPPGLDGLVFASADAQETAHQLRKSGFNANPPQHFSRSVICGSQQGEAKFSAVRLIPGSFSAGRVYFCQHHTPEWIWRQPWIQPGNIQGLTVVAREPILTANHYARLGQTPLLDIISYPQWQDQQGDLLPLADDRDSRFAAITFSGIAFEPIAQAAVRLALPHRQSEGKLRVALPDLALILEFNDE